MSNSIRVPYGQTPTNQLQSVMQQAGILDQGAESLLRMYFQMDAAVRDQLFASYPVMRTWLESMGPNTVNVLTGRFQYEIAAGERAARREAERQAAKKAAEETYARQRRYVPRVRYLAPQRYR